MSNMIPLLKNMLWADPGKERRTGRKVEEVPGGHQVTLHCHHWRAHIHLPEAPRRHRRRSEDLKNENAKKRTTEFKPLKKGRKSFVKGLTLPQNEITDPGDYQTQWRIMF